MPAPEPGVCLSRAEVTHLENMHGCRNRVKTCFEDEFVRKIGDFACHPPGQEQDSMEYPGNIEKSELASASDHGCIDV